jgi:hypothetical protein
VAGFAVLEAATLEEAVALVTDGRGEHQDGLRPERSTLKGAYGGIDETS